MSLRMGWVNVIWQGDANRIALECLPLAASPPFVVNVTGTEPLSVRALATALGQRLGREPRYEGTERPDALLSDTSRMRDHFALPETSLDAMLDRVAAWTRDEKPMLGKPTHFEEREGRF